MDSFLEQLQAVDFLECLNGVYPNDSFPHNTTIIIPNEINIEYIHETLYGRGDAATAAKLLNNCVFNGYMKDLGESSKIIYRKFGNTGVKVSDGKISSSDVTLQLYDDDLQVAIYEANVIFNKPPTIRVKKQSAHSDIRKSIASAVAHWDPTSIAYLNSNFLDYVGKLTPIDGILPFLDYNPLVSFMILFQPNNDTAIFPEETYVEWFSEMKDMEISHDKSGKIAKINGSVVTGIKFAKYLDRAVMTPEAWDKYLLHNSDIRDKSITFLKIKTLVNNISDIYNEFIHMKKYHYSLLSEAHVSMLNKLKDKLMYFDEMRFYAFNKNVSTLKPLLKWNFEDFTYFDTKSELHAILVAKFINSTCFMYIKPSSSSAYGGVVTDISTLNYKSSDVNNIIPSIEAKFKLRPNLDKKVLLEQLQAGIASKLYTQEQVDAIIKKLDVN